MLYVSISRGSPIAKSSMTRLLRFKVFEAPDLEILNFCDNKIQTWSSLVLAIGGNAIKKVIVAGEKERIQQEQHMEFQARFRSRADWSRDDRFGAQFS